MEKNPTLLLVVAAALRRPDGRWLMHRRPAGKQHGGLWEFPGGKVERGESPSQALVRELKEELGIVAVARMCRPVAFAEDTPPSGTSGVVILLYSVDEWEGEAVALEKGAAIGWFTSAEIEELPRPPLDCALCAQILTSEGYAEATV